MFDSNFIFTILIAFSFATMVGSATGYMVGHLFCDTVIRFIRERWWGKRR